MSINRLSHFLNLEELNPNSVEKTMPEHSESPTDCSNSLAISGQHG